MYDPWESMDEAARNDWAVRQHLYAQRALRDLDQVDTRARVAKMLAEVTPGARVCGMSSAVGADAMGVGKRPRAICGKPGVRMLALTGTWTCADHDPLGTCRARAGVWACSIPMAEHRCSCHTGGWLPHLFTTLEAKETA